MTQVDETLPTQADPGQAGQAGDPGEPEVIEALDPAQQSLSDALRVSFLVLKVAMIIAVVAYIFSGIFQVNENQKALRLRFGKIVGGQGGEVYGAGWHFGWPYPIEREIKVSMSPRTLNITKAFWYGADSSANEQSLNPLKDGSLLTGDANIVHARFTVSYKVTDPVAYARYVTTTSRAEDIMRAAAEQAVVSAVARAKADDVIRGEANQDIARQLLQDELDQMKTGLSVDSVSLNQGTMPQAVHAAYQAVTNAESQRAQAINHAKQKRTQILGSAAGQAGLPSPDGSPGPLVKLMDDYEFAYQAGDQKKADALRSKLNDALRTLTVTNAKGEKIAIGGEVASIINQAHSYGDQVQQQVLSERNNFDVLYKQYRENPRILADRLWQDARDKIFTGDVETFYVMPGQQYIVTNRSPAVQRRLQQQALDAAEKSAKQASSSSSGGN